jgi:hypothetical protein
MTKTCQKVKSVMETCTRDEECSNTMACTNK